MAFIFFHAKLNPLLRFFGNKGAMAGMFTVVGIVAGLILLTIFLCFQDMFGHSLRPEYKPPTHLFVTENLIRGERDVEIDCVQRSLGLCFPFLTPSLKCSNI